ncbi:hypothetical protein C8A05DRAFT_33403 [Staphylotrichum tortipilum]|uniref:Uncharacterized protein n=1 Tax=Staphylotrichum tortipilum TaxID=2831512 RepID=A0AAN6MLY4_9PEZI|nr:hypothetical protein C8A05DRAFT_33403 [Staphylotrichum longicolle]
MSECLTDTEDQPPKASERAKFLKELDSWLWVHFIRKSGQVKRYGQEVADEYRVGHTPPELVEEARKASERFLAEIEATDSDDLRMMASLEEEEKREQETREKGLPAFWWENDQGETWPYRFYCHYLPPTPLSRPQMESERVKFIKDLERGLDSILKSRQAERYGQEVAGEYQVDHVPAERVEEAKLAGERRLAEIEVTDSEDLRMLGRMEREKQKQQKQLGQVAPTDKRKCGAGADGDGQVVDGENNNGDDDHDAQPTKTHKASPDEPPARESRASAARRERRQRRRRSQDAPNCTALPQPSAPTTVSQTDAPRQAGSTTRSTQSCSPS